MTSDESPGENAPSHGKILVLRPLGGANCSSVGSVVDALFVASVVGGAMMTAVTVALATERILVVRTPNASTGSGPLESSERIDDPGVSDPSGPRLSDERDDAP